MLLAIIVRVCWACKERTVGSRERAAEGAAGQGDPRQPVHVGRPPAPAPAQGRVRGQGGRVEEGGAGLTTPPTFKYFMN